MICLGKAKRKNNHKQTESPSGLFFSTLKEVMYLKLTIKQQRFADEYIISGNATEAAIKAGYSKKYTNTNAFKLLQNTAIKEYIAERLEAINSAKIADQEEVLQYLTAVMRGETESTVVVVEGEGDGVSCARLLDKNPDEKEKLKAAELLGKRYGAFTDKVSVDGNIAVEFVGYDDVEE